MNTKDRLASFIFAGALFVLGLIYVFVLPPLCTPDETTHFATAYHYSNAIMGLEDEDTTETSLGIIRRNINMRKQDADTMIRFTSSVHTPETLYETVYSKPNESDNTIVVINDQNSTYSAVGYIPSIVVITLCRLLNIDAAIMIFAGRIVNLLLCAGLMLMAVREMPKSKGIIMTIGLLPMTLHLMASHSPDGLMIAATMYIIAKLLRFNEQKQISIKECILLGVSLTLVIALKTVMILVLVPVFLVLLASRKKISGKRNKVIINLYLLLVPVIIWLISYISSVIVPSLSQGEEISRFENGYTLSYILDNIFPTIKLLVKSLIIQIPNNAITLVGGSLGYLNIHLPIKLVGIVGLILLSSVITSGKDSVGFRPKNRILMIVIFAVYYVMSYVIMLMWWTTTTDTVIAGVQGRYFLVVLPLLLMAIQPKIKAIRWKNYFSPMAMAAINIVVLLCVYMQLN